MQRIIPLFFAMAAAALLPSVSYAQVKARPLEVSGWIPYWRVASGTADVLPHINTLSAISPFGYIVQNDGTLHDAYGLGSPTSSTSPLALALLAAAKQSKVRMVPTIMWSDGEAIHRILSNQKTRIALEDEITALAKRRGFDGVTIDFENKRAETKQYFSTFLKGLYQRMGKLWVYCAIEARTPLSSRYDGAPPPEASLYANDFVAINKYCDRVQIMAYDQQTTDVKLNASQNDEPYIPVADPAWVRKVVNLTAQTIPRKKIMIGVATYGYEWHAQPRTTSGYQYLKQWAFNPQYALDEAAKLGITPTRNSAGELSFRYTPEGDIDPGAFNILWWSDAEAIRQKVELAKELGVRGITLFKLDGGQDPALWEILSAR